MKIYCFRWLIEKLNIIKLGTSYEYLKWNINKILVIAFSSFLPIRGQCQSNF